MKKGRQYYAGFRCLRQSSATKSNISVPVAATTTITRGQAVFSSSGYAAGGTAFSTLFLGISLETVDNSAGEAGDKYVLVAPVDTNAQYIVPVEANAVITQAIVGLRIDLEAAGTVDVSDTTVTGYGFLVEGFDASTEAVAANTFGYAIGRIVTQ
jgi:hypothetical protein